MTEAAHWPPPQDPPAGASNTASHHRGDVVLAHFGWRLLAFLADALSTLAAFVVLLVADAVLFAWWAPESFTWIGLVAVIGATVYLRVKWEGDGGSPLRRRLGVLIVDADDLGPIGLRRGLVRAVVRLASELVFYLGYLWMLWDPRRQTWHDKAARSIVVKR